MIEFVTVSGDELGALLRVVKRTGKRFLGLDPATEPAALMRRRLEERTARLLVVRRTGVPIAVAGYVPSDHNPCLAEVALLALGPDDVGELLAPLKRFLWRHERIASLMKVVEYEDPSEAAFRASGFHEIGRLRRHTYAHGRYHDQVVLYAESTPEEAA